MGSAIVQGLHMFFAIFWFGGTLFANFVVGPAAARSLPASQADFGAQIGIQADRVIRPVATLAIILGFLRGTVWGPIHSAGDVFNSSYGRWWFIALLLAIATFSWAELRTAPAARAIATVPDAERPAQIQRTIRDAMVELVGFAGILSMMVLMRFGI
ncbi:MAG: hypothetical protein JOZ46_01590 [Candidatus Dormibacteraeota bacterium]|nr:hypothetical protein [Candidatus Dormibacteraeota bacterium]MBV9524488.1 hypothetical protein [Candidatus Dormibacteraeota bacterium]